MIELVMFDADGVLFDSIESNIAYYNAIFREVGELPLNTDEEVRSISYAAEEMFIARARGWQGSVDVGLLVLADGTVDAASLRRSSGYGVLDEAAIAVARQSRFSPPAAQGLPTPLHGRIEYRFELSDAR